MAGANTSAWEKNGLPFRQSVGGPYARTEKNRLVPREKDVVFLWNRLPVIRKRK